MMASVEDSQWVHLVGQNVDSRLGVDSYLGVDPRSGVHLRLRLVLVFLGRIRCTLSHLEITPQWKPADD